MLFLAFLSLGLLASAQSPSLLGTLPLVVKTPYLHSWIPNNDHQAPNNAWPVLFTLNKNLGWLGMIRVNNQAYQWLGNLAPSTPPVNKSNITANDLTPTKTIFTIQAGPIKFNATFFTPIEPTNYTRQSIPFAYLFVDGFVADDNQPHTIQLYSDITAEWVTHDNGTPVTWDTHDSSDIVYHHVQPRTPQWMIDNADSAEDGSAYYATHDRSGVTWQTGADQDVRGRFLHNGSLGNTGDIEYRAVGDRLPVFAFAIDLGSVEPNNQPDPVVWALGLVRDPLVNDRTKSSSQYRRGYYWSAYDNIVDVILDFLADFPNARLRSQSFDDGILDAALEISPEYAGILSLVTRQVLASIDITIPANDSGRPSASDVKIFMKHVSADRRTDPMEIIAPAFPALMYLNPSFAHDLLLPLFEFQSSPSYPNAYASLDLGTTYPTITGNTGSSEDFAIEHCGNMLIMAYAHAAKSGDVSLISEYHSLLQNWAEYLVRNSLHPNGAVSEGDGINYPGISNLALKGILGVYSMGKIDEVINPSNTTFKDRASELIQEWKQLAVVSDHIQAKYGNSDSWGLMYNLFPAVWLETGLIEDDILNNEAQFYLSNAPPGGQSYSLNSEQADIAHPHWSLTTATIIPAGFKAVRDTIIKSTYFQAYNVSERVPLPLRYSASTGRGVLGTIGSAAQGAAFGILAMSMKNRQINVTTNSTTNVTTNPGGNTSRHAHFAKKSPVGAIVGGVIGGIVFLLIVAGVILFWRRRMMERQKVVIEPLHDRGYVNSNTPTNRRFVPWLQNRYENMWPWTGHESAPPDREMSHDANGKIHSSVATTTRPITLLASKEREIQRQNQSQENQSSPAVQYEGGENLRAELEELRRVVEGMRNMDMEPPQPPPSYRNDVTSDAAC